MIYLTAHRVTKEDKGSESSAINAFAYDMPGDFSLTQSPDFDPLEYTGPLRHQSISMKPGGNHVYSFLDVVLKASLAPEDIKKLMDGVLSKEAQGFPLRARSKRCWIQFNLDAGMHPTWRAEFQDLGKYVLSIGSLL